MRRSHFPLVPLQPVQQQNSNQTSPRRFSGASVIVPRRPSRVPREARHGAGGGRAARAVDNQEVAAAEEEGGGDEGQRSKDEPLAMEVLRARRQAADAAGPHAQPPAAPDEGPRPLGAGQLHLIGGRR